MGYRCRCRAFDLVTGQGTLSKKAVFLSKRAVKMTKTGLLGHVIAMKDKDDTAKSLQHKIQKAGVGGAGHGHHGEGCLNLSSRAVTIP
jgi:hypothetical protein